MARLADDLSADLIVAGAVALEKVANLETERRLENLTAANNRLQRDRAGLTVERDALAVSRDELLAWISDLEQMVAAGEAASSAALAVLAERSASLEQTEQDLTTIGVHCTR